MSEPADKTVIAWTTQPNQDAAIDIATAIRRRDIQIRSRDRRLYLSAAIVAPSYAAVLWFLPDLRAEAAFGLALAIWLVWQTHQRSAARLEMGPVDLPCLVFLRRKLERERDVYLSMPKWALGPLVAGQLVILYTMFTNPRFSQAKLFPVGVAMFVGTAVVVLVVARRRWQREAAQIQRHLDVLSE